jgi:plasmid maintenance system antidote protein VapI
MRDLVIERKKALLDVSLKQTEVARRAGVARTLVNQVIRGTRKSPRVVAVLVDVFGQKRFAQLWPNITLILPAPPVLAP